MKLIFQKIKSLIASGDTDAALVELNEFSKFEGNEGLNDYAVLLLSRYNRLSNQAILGVITNEKKDIALNQINGSILNILNAIDKNGINNFEFEELLEEEIFDIRNVIKKINDLREDDKNVNTKLPKKLTSIPLVNPDFDLIGRVEDILELSKLLSNSKRPVNIIGMAGVGKTMFASGFIQKYYDNYQHIAWVEQANDINSIFSAKVDLVQNLGITVSNFTSNFNVQDEVLRKLRLMPRKNLLIIDNVDKRILNLKNELPTHPEWDVLFTSRKKIPYFESYNLGFLEENEALKLFFKYYTREKNQDDAISVVRKLGYHPLSIELFSKTAQQRRIPISVMKTELNFNNIDNIGSVNLFVEHRKGQFVKHPFYYLRSIFDFSDLSLDEKKIIKNISYLPTIPISFKKLSDLINIGKYFPKPSIGSFALMLDKLVSEGWLIYNEANDTYKLHDLLCQVVEEEIPHTFGDKSIIANNIINKTSLESSIKDIISKLVWINFALNLSNYLGSGIEKVSLHFNIGKLFRYVGNNEESEKNFLLAKENVDLLGETSYKIKGNIYSELGLLYDRMGRLSEAESLHKEAYEIHRNHFGDDDPITLNSFLNLGEHYIYQYAPQKGEPILKSVLDKYKKIFGETHSKTSDVYDNLGLINNLLGNYSKSIEFHEKSLKIRIENFSELHPLVTESLNNLAESLSKNGEREKAIKTILRGIEICEKIKDTGFYINYILLSNLAKVLNFEDRSKEFDELFKKQIEETESYCGKESLQLADVFVSACYYYIRTYQNQLAIDSIDRAIEINEKKLGKNTSQYATSLNFKADALSFLNQDLDLALDLYLKALKIRKTTLSPDHSHYRINIENLGRLYKKLGDFKNAIKYFNERVLLEEKIKGINHPDLAFYLNLLSNCYEENGQLKKVKEINMRITNLTKS